MSCLMGSKMGNPMPEHSSFRELADEFWDFFMEKITTIDNDLENTPKFCCPDYNPMFKFTEFLTLSKDYVRTIIMLMETKSCEIDILPAFFLKSNLHKLLLSLTNTVNFSLLNGIFADKWTLAILRPLIKSQILILWKVTTG